MSPSLLSPREEEEEEEEEEGKKIFVAASRKNNEDEEKEEKEEEDVSTPPKQQQQQQQEAIVCVQTVVHRSKIGVVVGLRGRTVFNIERRTGASVSIVREEEEEEEEEVKVVLTGTAKMCKEAARIIASIADASFVDVDGEREDNAVVSGEKKETRYGRRAVSVSRRKNGGGAKLRPLDKAFLGWTRKSSEEEEDYDDDEDEDSTHSSENEEDVLSTEEENDDERADVFRNNHHHATTTTTTTTKQRKTLPLYERDASRFFGALATATVRIPDSKVALIIGKHGAHIEFLRHMTNCSLNMASEVVDVREVFLGKDESVFKAATNMAERVLLIESTSLTDVARCVALVADVVEGTLYLQSKKPGGVGFSSTDDDAMPNMKEIHVSVRQYASLSTKKTFRVKAKDEAKRTFTFPSSSAQQQQQQQQQQQRQQRTPATASQSRRTSTSSSAERRSFHHQHHQQQHCDPASSYYDYYPPSLKFDPITNELLAIVPPPAVSAPIPPSSIIVNVDGDDYFCEDDESDAYSTDSEFAA